MAQNIGDEVKQEDAIENTNQTQSNPMGTSNDTMGLNSDITAPNTAGLPEPSR